MLQEHEVHNQIITIVVILIVLTYQVIEVLQQVLLQVLHHQVHRVQVGVEQHVEIKTKKKIVFWKIPLYLYYVSQDTKSFLTIWKSESTESN